MTWPTEGESVRLASDPVLLESDKAYQALFEIGAQIQAQQSRVEGVFELIVEKAVELMSVDLAWLALVEDSPIVKVRSAYGVEHAAFKHMEIDIGRGVGGVALAQGQTIVVPDYAVYSQDTSDDVRSAVVEEGLASMICAPMLREGRMVGALYVGNRTRTDFSGRDASLVSALAAQASIAIENSRLFKQLESKNALLEQTGAIHRRLTDASLQGAGLDGVATTLSELLDRTVVVEQDQLPPFTRAYGPDPDDAESESWSIPIMAGEDELGRVMTYGTTALDELGRRALEHGATVLAVELLKERTAKDVEWRLGGELLNELLHGTGGVDRRLAARAARFGVDARSPHRIAVLESTEPEIDERAVRLAAARTLEPGQRPVLVATLGPGRAVIAIPPTLYDRLDGVLRPVRAAAAGRGSCSVGVSRSTTDLPRALREALACARFATLSGRVDAIVTADDLGAMRFLFALEDPRPLSDYVEEQLGRLMADPRCGDMQLMSTLRAFLESDGHHGTIAERCHIHKSTVKYRLARIGEILDRPLTDPDVRFELRIAIGLADALSALALAPALRDPALRGADEDIGTP